MRSSAMLGRVLTALAVAGGMTVAAAPAATAVTTADAFCETGGGKFYCFAEHDAIAPYTIQWTINGYHHSALDNREFTGQLSCGKALPSVYVTVTDATGSVTGGGIFSCNYGPWP